MTRGGSLRIFPPPVANLELVDGYLDVEGFHNIGLTTEELVSVGVPNPREGGSWRLGSPEKGAWAAYFLRDSRTEAIESYDTNQQVGGEVRLTRFDPKRHLAEGTFQFDAPLHRRVGPRHLPDTLHIRNGKFRARYRIIPAHAYSRPHRD